MTTQTEAERLADMIEQTIPQKYHQYAAAAELRRLVSFNKDLMDEVARLNKTVADEREACAKVAEWTPDAMGTAQKIAAAIRARGNT